MTNCFAPSLSVVLPVPQSHFLRTVSSFIDTLFFSAILYTSFPFNCLRDLLLIFFSLFSLCCHTTDYSEIFIFPFSSHVSAGFSGTDPALGDRNDASSIHKNISHSWRLGPSVKNPTGTTEEPSRGTRRKSITLHETAAPAVSTSTRPSQPGFMWTFQRRLFPLLCQIFCCSPINSCE